MVFIMNKKFSFRNKAVVFLLAVNLSLAILSGCQSKNIAANSANKSSSDQNSAGPKSD